MALLGISTGTTPNDGTGDSLIVGADKINKNFEEIYNAIGNGTTIFAGSPNMQAGIITASAFYGNGSNLEGVGADVSIQDNGTGIGTARVINFGDYLDVSSITSTGICTVTSTFVGSNQLGVRTDVSQTTGSIADDAAADIQFAGFKSYTLYKVQTSAAAWVTLYTSPTTRTADASRNINTDPANGSGVIAEVITTGAQTQLITPATIGFNDDNPVTTTIYAKAVNKSGSTQNITVTLTILQLET
tara:strand:- start:1454 stop:2188 length:735 start_codon:yes stop_codon:yes gene_type:complete